MSARPDPRVDNVGQLVDNVDPPHQRVDTVDPFIPDVGLPDPGSTLSTRGSTTSTRPDFRVDHVDLGGWAGRRSGPVGPATYFHSFMRFPRGCMFPSAAPIQPPESPTADPFKMRMTYCFI